MVLELTDKRVVIRVCKGRRAGFAASRELDLKQSP